MVWKAEVMSVPLKACIVASNRGRRAIDEWMNKGRRKAMVGSGRYILALDSFMLLMESFFEKRDLKNNPRYLLR